MLLNTFKYRIIVRTLEGKNYLSCKECYFIDEDLTFFHCVLHAPASRMTVMFSLKDDSNVHNPFIPCCVDCPLQSRKTDLQKGSQVELHLHTLVTSYTHWSHHLAPSWTKLHCNALHYNTLHSVHFTLLHCTNPALLCTTLHCIYTTVLLNLEVHSSSKFNSHLHIWEKCRFHKHGSITCLSV